MAQVQRERHWLWSADAEDSFGFDRAFSEAKFWACGVYARACDRLRTADAGHNAATIHNPPCINADCLQIAVCCPFYGLFIGKLQQRVRLFYGIEGCDWDDFWDACCCPCLTLVRSEQEIILRERLANDPNGCDKAYQRQDPMNSTYGPPSSCCLAEGGCFTSCCRGPSRGNPQRSLDKSVVRTEHKVTKPVPAQVTTFTRHGAPEHINLRNLHAHDDRPPAPLERHVTPHRVEDDHTVHTAHTAASKGKFREHVRILDPGRATPISEVSHTLEQDPITARRIGTPRHDLSQDPMTLTHESHALPHSIHHDPVVSTNSPALTHSIHHDPAVGIKQNAGVQHSLAADHAASARPGHVHAHVTIDDETAVSARRTGAGTH